MPRQVDQDVHLAFVTLESPGPYRDSIVFVDSLYYRRDLG
jgi:hypothetical protein